MKKTFAKFWFSITGWKIAVSPEQAKLAKHSVMVAAPHTSNWDFPFAILGFWLMEIHVRYFIKDNYTKSILGSLFKWTGAIGVDRSQKNNLVEFTANLLNENAELVILVPAEGTRKWVEKWRTGFYSIAIKAGVPISMGYLDYKNKVAGIGHVFNPSGNFEEDMAFIQKYYKNIPGKNPELYNPDIF